MNKILQLGLFPRTPNIQMQVRHSAKGKTDASDSLAFLIWQVCKKRWSIAPRIHLRNPEESFKFYLLFT